MAQKPSIPKGMRDFDPQTMVKRYFIFDTIKSVFKRFGYLPIETPAMENLSTLLGNMVKKEINFSLRCSIRVISFRVLIQLREI
jgi:histidyl-tRNA synthetase